MNLYEVEFGRDSLEVSLTLIDDFPKVARRTLLSLASTQGVKVNSRSEEEPGKIIHENRDPRVDKIAQNITLNSGWEWPYYGSVDATLLFLQLGHEYTVRYGPELLEEKFIDKKGKKVKIHDSLRNAASWAEGRMDKSPHGLIEYKKESPGGIHNQVWRDSKEGYHHADGEIADNTYGIASFSVQVDAYKAFKSAADLFPEDKENFLDRAYHLKNEILNHFWVEDERGGYFVLGSERIQDGHRSRLKVRTSDMGHILDSDILAGDEEEIKYKRENLIKTLLSPALLDRRGIRTLANFELSFSPGAYHNGSVWPRELARIVRGLMGLGYYGLAHELDKRNVEIPKAFGLYPELVRGDNEVVPKLNERIVKVKRSDKGQEDIYHLEQPGQLIQAWTVSSVLASEKRLDLVAGGIVPEFASDLSKREFENAILREISIAA